jgi:hypothetical protein
MNKFTRPVVIALVIASFTLVISQPLQIVYAQSSSILIRVVYNDSASNKFGKYLGEILRAEGLSSFDMASLGSIAGAASLTPYQVVILAETPLSASQAGYFTSYVNSGGHLIAMRPDPQIKGLFGLNTPSGTLTDGYLKMPGNGPSAGLSIERLQIHGDTNQYTLVDGTATIAQLYTDDSIPTSTYPAVVRSSYKRATAFLYDLAKNVVYTRQGNPANANVDADADGVLRTVDLFQDSGGGDPWVNLDKIPIPQADEQQRLFARLIREAIEPVYPIPQLWYFPGTAKTMLIPTGDAHANPHNYFEIVMDNVINHHGRITLYLTSWNGTIEESDVLAWGAQGNSFGIHPYGTIQPTTYTNLLDGYTEADTWFDARYSLPKSRTVRNHQVTWVGWTDGAEIAMSLGLKLDMNFYHWWKWLQKDDGTWAHGYITGSGQPMKFIKADGTILPYYQQLTQFVDEQLFDITTAGEWVNENLSIPQALDMTEDVMDRSLAGDYAALVTQFHIDYDSWDEILGWVTGTLDYAYNHNVPIWNADQWLTYTETRYAANYSNFNWNPTTRIFTFNLAAPNPGQPEMTLSTMLPLSFQNGAVASVMVDGNPASYTTQTIKGIPIAFVTVPAGNHTFAVQYAGSPPVVTPTAPPAGSPPLNWNRSPFVRLNWTAVTWAEYYEIQVSENATFTSPLVLSDILTPTTLSAPISLPHGGEFFWRVRAKHPVTGWQSWAAQPIQRLTVDLP